MHAMLGLAKNDIISSVGSKSSTSQGTKKSLNASKQSNVLSSTSTLCRRTRRRGLNCTPHSLANTSLGHHSSTHGPLHRIHRTSHIRCVLWPWSCNVTKEKTHSHEQDDASIQSGSPPCCTGTNSKVTTSPLHSRGPKRGRNCYVNPAFSGIPKTGYKFKSDYLTPAFLGAQKRAELLRNPCVLGGPQKGIQKEPSPGQWKKAPHGGPR